MSVAESPRKSSFPERYRILIVSVPIVILASHFGLSLAVEFQWFEEGSVSSLSPILEPGFYAKFFFSIYLVFLVGRTYLAPDREPRTGMAPPLVSYDGPRLLLALFFFLYALVVAVGMVPLPDQPPRIDFRGVLCLTLGMVISWQCLLGKHRLVLMGIWLFIIWVARGQLEKRLRFLEMMLEPLNMEKVTYFALGLIFLILISPTVLGRFAHRKPKQSKPLAPLLLKRGFPF